MVGENLATIRDLAEWRLEHLDWLEKSEKNLFPLINKPVPPPQQPAAAQGATTPSPTQQAANQIAPTPATVR